MNKESYCVTLIKAVNKYLDQTRLNIVFLLDRFFTHTKSKPLVTKNDETPPKFAQYLLYLFVNKGNRDALLGDLEEEYWVVYDKFGPKRARFFYQVQVFKSIWPLISASVGKFIKLFFKGIVARFSISK